MDRRDELIRIIDNNELLLPLVDEILFLETKLRETREIPFYKVHPDDRQKQKMLPAFRVYKETLQQYTNCIKVVAKATGLNDSEEESPLRQWVRERSE